MSGLLFPHLKIWLWSADLNRPDICTVDVAIFRFLVYQGKHMGESMVGSSKQAILLLIFWIVGGRHDTKWGPRGVYDDCWGVKAADLLQNNIDKQINVFKCLPCASQSVLVVHGFNQPAGLILVSSSATWILCKHEKDMHWFSF